MIDLYSKKASSRPQKLLITFIQILLIGLSGWIMFGAGQEILSRAFGWQLFEPAPERRWIILGFSVIVLIRLTFTMFYLMKRAIPWPETVSVPTAFALYYVGFAILVLPSQAPLGFWDWAAIALFVLGSALNTISELQRDRFKRQAANKGKLYTGGLFALSMHINFFGDILWVVAYAIVSQNPWSILIPVFLTMFFALFNIPALDKYLALRYGADFKAYRARTKRLVPFIW